MVALAKKEEEEATTSNNNNAIVNNIVTIIIEGGLRMTYTRWCEGGWKGKRQEENRNVSNSIQRVTERRRNSCQYNGEKRKKDQPTNQPTNLFPIIPGNAHAEVVHIQKGPTTRATCRRCLRWIGAAAAVIVVVVTDDPNDSNSSNYIVVKEIVVR